MPFPFQKLGRADEVWPPWSNLIWNVSGQHVGLCDTSPEPGATTNPLAAFLVRSALSTGHTGIKRGIHGDPGRWPGQCQQVRENPLNNTRKCWLGSGRAGGRRLAAWGALPPGNAFYAASWCGGCLPETGDSRQPCQR